MKIAIVGSRGITVGDLSSYIPHDCDEIVSGGARGVDSCAAEFASHNRIKLTEILPDYKAHGRAAPIIRNRMIVDRADQVIAFWDGVSKGTLYVIKYSEKTGTPCRTVIINPDLIN